ncbi:MAG: formylglycine-generating enzyme family protein [Planctomycetes bacterium]|nr:formylglycine-generating enzyme family protein [Planctomycetota bacterium]
MLRLYPAIVFSAGLVLLASCKKDVKPDPEADADPVATEVAQESAPQNQSVFELCEAMGETFLERAKRYEATLQEHHVNQGMTMPRAMIDPDPRGDNSSGHFEDGCFNTGLHLAALSLEYAVTNSADARERAKRAADGLQLLERVTGVPGVFSRYARNTGGYSDEENWVFFPWEWHDSPTMPGWRWLGDVSSDQLSGLMFGYALYFDLCADEEEKARVAENVDRIMGRIVDHDMQIVDVDDKVTLWGQFSPRLPHQELNSLLALAHLRIAGHVTGKIKYTQKFNQLVGEHKYLEDAVMSAINVEPGKYANGSDDFLAWIMLYAWSRIETEPMIQEQVHRSLERFWINNRAGHQRAYFDFLYRAMNEDSQPVHADSMLWLIKNDIRPRKGSLGGVEGLFQESPVKYTLTYWTARHHGILSEDEREVREFAEISAYREGVDLKDATNWGRVPREDPGEGQAAGMVYVPAGEFVMGSNVGDIDERPRRTARIANGYWIDRYEVTNAEFAKEFPEHGFDEGMENHPAVVTWQEATDYAMKVGKRLPTEEEWEKAARGTNGRTFPWGEFFDWSLVAWDDREEVGQYPAGRSPYGCYDMAGNVWEWTASWYKPYYGNGHRPSYHNEIWYGEKYRVYRGGAGFNQRANLRCSYRAYGLPNDLALKNHPNRSVGFRCVKDAPAPELNHS